MSHRINSTEHYGKTDQHKEQRAGTWNQPDRGVRERGGNAAGWRIPDEEEERERPNAGLSRNGFIFMVSAQDLVLKEQEPQNDSDQL